ncbi:MAG: TetR/AcrR family transcriptional regulator [Lachnotalea sp.]
MSKKEQLIEFNRTIILDAAQELFEEKGILQTTMDDIAQKADYSKSTLYVYFKSKEEIYNHIVYKSMIMLRDKLKQSIEESNEYEICFFAICSTLVDFQEEYSLYFESITGKIGISQDDFEKQPILFEIYTMGEKINEVITKLLENGVKDGCFRKDIVPMSTTFALWASISGIITMASQKESYLIEKTNMNKRVFLNYGFQMLWNSLRGEK